MGSDGSQSESTERTAAQFATTHWSTVLRAGAGESAQSQAALEKLCRQYWFPLYAFVRRKGYSPEDAQDLTQSFFASMFQRHAFGRADGRRGRFRTFLLSALQNHLRMERRAQVAIKRGSGISMLSWDALNAEERYRGLLIEHSTPERVFERRWAMALFELVLEKLRQEFVRRGKGETFDRFREHIWTSGETTPYGELGGDLGVPAGTLRMTVHRMRLRYRELLREEVAQTVAEPSEVEPELRYLIGIMSE
jgi:RNA polymerase sigma-70 factor (ECF subfamily)